MVSLCGSQFTYWLELRIILLGPVLKKTTLYDTSYWEMGQCIVGDFIKYLVCIVLKVVKWKNGHLGEFLVGFVGVVGLCG